MPAVTSNSDFKQAQTGMQPGRIFKIIDLGTQKGEYKGEPKINRQLQFGFELPEDLMEDGRPLSVNKKINLTVGDRAALTKLAIACGEPKPGLGFDPICLIGRACNLTLESWTNGDKSGVGITGFAPLMKNQKVADLQNEKILFDIDKFDQTAFDNLHDHYRGLIMQSPEYAELKSGKQNYAAAKATGKPNVEHEEIDDEIPF